MSFFPPSFDLSRDRKKLEAKRNELAWSMNKTSFSIVNSQSWTSRRWCSRSWVERTRSAWAAGKEEERRSIESGVLF